MNRVLQQENKGSPSVDKMVRQVFLSHLPLALEGLEEAVTQRSGVWGRGFQAEAIGSEMPRNEQEFGKVKKLKGKSGWELRVKGRMVGSEEGEVGRQLHTTALQSGAEVACYYDCCGKLVNGFFIFIFIFLNQFYSHLHFKKTLLAGGSVSKLLR